MKKALLIIALAFCGTAFASSPIDVNQKVLQAFHETFHKAKNVVWQEYEHFYQANFWQADINIRVNYDKEGNVLSTLRYYSENQLPPHIIAKLHKKYAKQQVFGVTEVSSENALKYIITLQDKTYWYTIQSDAYGNTYRTDKFKKA